MPTEPATPGPVSSPDTLPPTLPVLWKRLEYCERLLAERSAEDLAGKIGLLESVILLTRERIDKVEKALAALTPKPREHRSIFDD